MTENALTVYNLIKEIPKGKITTYKIIANKLGIKSFRAVGQILKRNPDAPATPCHRVVKTSGELGGYAGKNFQDKILILKTEGIEVVNNKIKNFSDKIHYFNER